MTKALSRKEFLRRRSAMNAQLAREIAQDRTGSRVQSQCGAPPPAEAGKDCAARPRKREGAASARADYSTRDLPFGPDFEPDYSPDFSPPEPSREERRQQRSRQFLATGDLS